MTTAIKRRTTIKQSLTIEVDLGPLPPQAAIPKLRVTRKRDGHEMFVNERDFGEPDAKPKPIYTSLHYEVVDGYDPDLDPRNNMEPSSIDSKYTAEDLAVMTVAEIRRTPECSRITAQERARLNSKQAWVDAILAQRSATPAKTVTRESM